MTTYICYTVIGYIHRPWYISFVQFHRICISIYLVRTNCRVLKDHCKRWLIFSVFPPMFSCPFSPLMRPVFLWCIWITLPHLKTRFFLFISVNYGKYTVGFSENHPYGFDKLCQSCFCLKLYTIYWKFKLF